MNRKYITLKPVHFPPPQKKKCVYKFNADMQKKYLFAKGKVIEIFSGIYIKISKFKVVCYIFK